MYHFSFATHYLQTTSKSSLVLKERMSSVDEKESLRCYAQRISTPPLSLEDSPQSSPSIFHLPPSRVSLNESFSLDSTLQPKMNPKKTEEDNRLPMKPSFDVRFGRVTDDIYNKCGVCIVVNHNCVSYTNFGMCKDIVEKYPYADLASRRRVDAKNKLVAKREDWSNLGSYHLTEPSLDESGPHIATIVSQFFPGRDRYENNLTKQIINNSDDLELVNHLLKDTYENRKNAFSDALYLLSTALCSGNYCYVNKVIIPFGLGRRGRIDEEWLNDYLPVINSFAQDMMADNKDCILLGFEDYLEYLSNKYSSNKNFQMLKMAKVIKNPNNNDDRKALPSKSLYLDDCYKC